ncbi:hypothetical protein L1987_47924 [Smallanthus sonchifolius]|uniref:Uncharacterized protein n=1 Tax=Smallanthus sonchifolius TaxID=185202 RepID=A0ACB9FS45_9ASTR|nr:hypothetical protein L1987_47924 [Smallanthus sonchifolius]
MTQEVRDDSLAAAYGEISGHSRIFRLKDGFRQFSGPLHQTFQEAFKMSVIGNYNTQTDNDFKDLLERLVKRVTEINSKGRKPKKTMDLRRENSYPIESAFKCITFALICVAKQREDKPSREEILQILDEIDALNE